MLLPLGMGGIAGRADERKVAIFTIFALMRGVKMRG
jgi:hypothetical protein